MSALMPERIDHSEGRRLFGHDLEGYDEARPAYPEALFRFLDDQGAIRPDTRTLEIGAGTGVATRRLIALGANPITIVEPDPRFGPSLRALAGSVDARCEIVQCAFEDFEGAGFYDLVAAATSFHWVQPSVGIEKLAALLEPGGHAALWWNVLCDLDKADPFHDATQDILGDLAMGPTGAPNALPFALDRAAREADLARSGAFETVRYFETRFTHLLDTRGVGKLYEGFSHIQRLSEAERSRVLRALMTVADQQFDGRVERNVTSVLYLARRRG